MSVAEKVGQHTENYETVSLRSQLANSLVAGNTAEAACFSWTVGERSSMCRKMPRPSQIFLSFQVSGCLTNTTINQAAAVLNIPVRLSQDEVSKKSKCSDHSHPSAKSKEKKSC